MRIAITEDLKEERENLREKLERFLSEKGMTAEIHEFDSGEKLLDSFRSGEYDLCFLDIYMHELTGMETARVIAGKDPGCSIIFLTSSTDYIQEGYDVRAWRYLLKPLTMEMLVKAMNPWLAEYLKNAGWLSVTADRREVEVPYSTIIGITLENRKIEIHTDKTIIVADGRWAFTEFVKPLMEDKRFAYCNQNTVVNLQKVQSIDSEAVAMQGGGKFLVSRRKLQDLKKAYMHYCLQSG